MRKKGFRCTAIVLALIMATLMFAGCGANNQGAATNTSTTAASTTANVEKPAELSVALCTSLALIYIYKNKAL